MVPLALAVVAYVRVFFVSRHNLALEAAALRQQLAARTSHLQSMCDAGPIRSMGPVSLLKVKPAAVTCVLTSQWAIEIARGPEEIGP